MKWHFFVWPHVTNSDVQVLKIAMTDQLADYLTKGLNRETFKRIRKLAQGWWHAVFEPHICWVDFRRAFSLILVSPSVLHSCLFLHYFEFHCMRGRVEVPGRDVCIPILFVLRILSRESETRTLSSTSTDYQKKLQMSRYKVLINLSCHDGDSTMINFGQLTLPRHHVCKMLNDQFNHHVWESRSWNFSFSQHIWRLNPPLFVLKFVVSSWSMNTFIAVGVLFPLRLKVIPQISGLQNRRIRLVICCNL